MAPSLEQVYRYPFASRLSEPVSGAASHQLCLATSDSRGQAHPHFFEGHMKEPRLVAEALRTLHGVVASRFFTPANSIAKAISLADPVVTSGGGLLRFEGFSSCCSAYARLDLLPGSYDGDVIACGTTNVDFNAPMRTALARVSDARGLSLSVGRDALTLRAGDVDVIERKVALPSRWVRGLLEVQSFMASMTPRLTADKLQVQRFLRALPRTSTSRTPLWVSRTAAGLATSTLPAPEAVRVTDAQRLLLLQALTPLARGLTVYADPAHPTSAWVLDLGQARVTLALSAETWRGFSGEAQALRALLRHGDGSGAATGFERLRAALRWQSQLDPQVLAKELGWTPAAVDDGLRVLGACGAVGFDVAEACYFQRQLPLDLDLLADMHPRLRDARNLLAAGAVQRLRITPFEASVLSGTVTHRVREVAGELHCTCPWFARHRGERGPCKHVLAAEAARTDPAPSHEL